MACWWRWSPPFYHLISTIQIQTPNNQCITIRCCTTMNNAFKRVTHCTWVSSRRTRRFHGWWWKKKLCRMERSTNHGIAAALQSTTLYCFCSSFSSFACRMPFFFRSKLPYRLFKAARARTLRLKFKSKALKYKKVEKKERKSTINCNSTFNHPHCPY